MGWRPSSRDGSPWLTVDLGAPHSVTALQLQGGFARAVGDGAAASAGLGRASWVSELDAYFSLDGQTWWFLSDRLRGNNDAQTVVTRELGAGLATPLVARYVKLAPHRCARAGAAPAPASAAPGNCALRVEVLGRSADEPAGAPPRPLGAAAGGGLPGAAFSASSHDVAGSRAEAGRLRGEARPLRAGGWSPGCAPAAGAAGDDGAGTLAGAAAFAFRRLPAARAPAARRRRRGPDGDGEDAPGGAAGGSGGGGGGEAAAASAGQPAKAAAKAAAKPRAPAPAPAPAPAAAAGVDGCGAARGSEPGEWLQIDLGRELVISAIGTQGSSTLATVVTELDASFSNDGVRWVRAPQPPGAGAGARGGRRRRRRADRLAVAGAGAAADADVEAVTALPRPVSARFVRLAPTAWRSVAAQPPAAFAPGLRVELYGPEGYAPGERGCRLQAGALRAPLQPPLRAPAAPAAAAGPLPAGLALAETMPEGRAAPAGAAWPLAEAVEPHAAGNGMAPAVVLRA